MEISGFEFEYQRRPSRAEAERILNQRDWILANTVHLEALPERSRLIIEQRYGIHDGVIRRYATIAESFGLDKLSMHDVVHNSIADLHRASENQTFPRE